MPPDSPDPSAAKPFVLDDGTTRSLHFTSGELQSRMDSRQPWLLEVDYTRTMMGFLLFQPAPRRLAMIGLGGGSIAKFCHRQLPACRLEVAEINPHVIALRRAFALPDDDARLAVVECDGADFVAARPGGFEVLLVDGFDSAGQPPRLCSQRFYDDCHAALAPDGVLVVNLHHDEPDYPVYVARLQRAFDGNVVEVLSAEKSNAVAFASRGAAISPRALSVTTALAGLDGQGRSQLKLEFARIVWNMRDLAG